MLRARRFATGDLQATWASFSAVLRRQVVVGMLLAFALFGVAYFRVIWALEGPKVQLMNVSLRYFLDVLSPWCSRDLRPLFEYKFSRQVTRKIQVFSLYFIT